MVTVMLSLISEESSGGSVGLSVLFGAVSSENGRGSDVSSPLSVSMTGGWVLISVVVSVVLV